MRTLAVNIRWPMEATGRAIRDHVAVRYLSSLDSLRGIAALAVVVYHWAHLVPSAHQSDLPGFSAMRFIYEQGWRAVDLFFCLSGFIFYWLYSDRIRSEQTSAKEFAVLRLSRLYPLHVATLVLVVIGQRFFFSQHAGHFVYPANDLTQFVLHSVMANAWFSSGETFNGPAWSISVEVFLYAVFFVLCRFGLMRWWHLLVLVLVGYMVRRHVSVPIGRGLVGFFCGGLAFYAFGWLVRRQTSPRAFAALTLSTACLWLAFTLDWHGLAYREMQGALGDSMRVAGRDVFAATVGRLSSSAYEVILFPLTIVSVALAEVRIGRWPKRFNALGQISYSSYLIHFPLQLAAFMLLPSWVFHSGASVFVFLAVLTLMSVGCYRFVERPAQEWIRMRLLPARQPGKAAS